MPSKSGIIVTCVVVAASVVASALYLQPQLFAVSKEPYSAVTFEGQKDVYLAGEPIEFYVRVKGYGCDSGFPTVWIGKVSGNQTQPVWTTLGEIRSFPAGYSCPDEEINQARHIGDMQAYNTVEQERLRTEGPMPIVLDEGKYVVHVEGGTARVTMTREFTVRAP